MTAVAARRTALWLFLAALVLATTPACPRNWETWPTTSNQPARPAGADADVDPVLTPPMQCGSVPGGGELCTSGYLPGSPQARMVAAALLELRVTRSARGGTL